MPGVLSPITNHLERSVSGCGHIRAHQRCVSGVSSSALNYLAGLHEPSASCGRSQDGRRDWVRTSVSNWLFDSFSQFGPFRRFTFILADLELKMR